MLVDLSFLRPIRPLARSGAGRVLVINGHPDPRTERFCAALCTAVAEGAKASGHWIRLLNLGKEKTSFECESAFERLWWSDRLFVVYPLWLGGPPTRLGLLFDEFAQQSVHAGFDAKDRDVHVVITASLPSLLYRGRGIRHLPGLEAAPTTVIGSIDAISKSDRERWLVEMHRRGRREG